MSTRNERDHGDPKTTLRRAASPWRHERPAETAKAAWQRRSLHLGVGQKQGTTGAEAEADVGVGGLHRSEEVGERMAADPAEQRRPVSR